MDETAFSVILHELMHRLPGSLAAAIVDYEGETVDYANGSLDPFEMKLVAAHWRIALASMQEQSRFTTLRWVVTRAERRSFLVYLLPEDYALVVVQRWRGAFVPFARPIATAVRALSKEAVWPPPVEAPPIWHAVEVTTDARRRPDRIRIGEEDVGLVVLGKLATPSRLTPGTIRPEPKEKGRDRGWRVRLDSGKELTLVREPGGHWYADDEPR